MMARKKVRVGGRASPLAMAQSRLVMDDISASHPELELELVTFRTAGDVNMKPFAEASDPAGIKGLFTLELERALLSGEIDLAVHSLKDVPMVQDPRLPIVAYSRREDPRDALVLPLDPDGRTRKDDGGPVGCSSLRRHLQLAGIFPGRPVKPVRGNIQTRLRKLDEGEFSMLVLAAAGLRRLGLGTRAARLLSVDEMVPAAGQGILACQGRADEAYEYLDAVRDRDAEDCALAERSFAAALGGGCTRPVGAFASLEGDALTLMGFYSTSQVCADLRGSVTGHRSDAEELGRRLAVSLCPELADREVRV